MDDWDHLLASSESLVHGDPLGMPRVSRTMDQVQQLSEKLVSRIQHRDTTTDGLASARLLSQQGVNQRQLSKALSNFEMKATYEDVYQTQQPNVDEYLRHVQQATLLSAIHEAQKDAASAFDDFMDQCIQSDWARDREKLVHTIMPVGGTAKSHPNRQASLTATSNALFLEAATGSASMDAKAQISDQAKRYGDVVCNVNKALVGASQDQFDAVKAFLDACPEEDKAEKRMTMHKTWCLLHTMSAELKRQVSGSDVTLALNMGARSFLEQSYQQYVRSELQQHRNQGALSSSSTLAQLRAFAKIRAKVVGSDRDLDWEVLYLALRCGHSDEAIKVAKDIRDPTCSMLGQASVGQVLEQWLQAKQSLPPQLQAQVAAECRHQQNDRSSSGPLARQHKFRLATHVVLAADPNLADHIAREPIVIATIEDFMWLKLHMVQPTASSSAATSSRLSPTSSSNLLSLSYTMAALQEEVLHWGPNFFSQNGTQPLVYVAVLLMSQHFGQAVQYMGSQAELKDHGAHLAIACNHLKLLNSSQVQAEAQINAASQMIQEYGQALTVKDARLALDYYWQAAAVLGGATSVKEQLLRQLLTESKAYGTLLGSGGVGDSGALSSFIPEGRERRQVMEAVGDACEQQGQMEAARELYLAAPNPCAALRIINRQLSDLIKPAITDQAAKEELESLLMRAKSTISNMQNQQNPGLYSSRSRDQECEAFECLLTIRELLTAAQRQDFNTVLQQLHSLPFIPDRQGIVKRCQDDTNKRLHVAIRPRLSSIISAAHKAFAASRQSDKLSALARYAACVDCIDQGIVSDINKAASQML